MITCRLLGKYELNLYGEFLKARGTATREIYFGYRITNEGIDQLLAKMQEHRLKHNIVVAENTNLEIVGTLHMAQFDHDKVELGIMVAEDSRKQGIADLMMQYAIPYCQNRNLHEIYMHCLGHNEAVIHLVKKYGLEVSKKYGDADAYVTLPPANMFTLGQENWMRSTECLKRVHNQNVLTFKKIAVFTPGQN